MRRLREREQRDDPAQNGCVQSKSQVTEQRGPLVPRELVPGELFDEGDDHEDRDKGPSARKDHPRSERGLARGFAGAMRGIRL